MYGLHRWNLEEEKAKVERVGGFDTSIPGRECQDLTWMKPAEECALERPAENCSVQDSVQQYAAWRTPINPNDSGCSIWPQALAFDFSEIPRRFRGLDCWDRRSHRALWIADSPHAVEMPLVQLCAWHLGPSLV